LRKMPFYLTQVSYTPESVASLVKNPRNRAEEIRPVIERLGGKLHGFWFAFGEYDVVLLAEFPSNANVAAVVLAAFGAGGLRGIKTTPLLSIEETMDALTKASNARYQSPTKTGIQVPA
jgi:uncharacterized protein with GYD domain